MRLIITVALAACLSACAVDVNGYYGRNRQVSGTYKQVTHP